MIEDESGLRFVYFFKQCAESIRIELSVGHQPDRHKAGFQFLIAAVTQKRGIDTQRNAELCDLFLPHFRNRHARRNRDRLLDKQLPRQLLRSMARCHVADFVGNNRRKLIIVRRQIDEPSVQID